MRARHLRFPLAGLLAWLVACVGLGSAASAATITVRTDRWGDSATYYVAGAGERNDVIVVSHDDNVTVTDLGATVTPVGSRCRSVSAQRAVCRGELMTAHISVGDMDDRVATTQNIDTDADMVVHGGPGNDVVRGGVNEDAVLNGDDGNDELHAGGGMGDLRGGDGNDVLDGGEDYDKLDGGPGADRVYGGDGEDQLDGGGGQDQLFGGRGRDWLTDGDRDGAPGDAAPGPDTLVGGGNGRPFVEGPEGDTLS